MMPEWLEAIGLWEIAALILILLPLLLWALSWRKPEDTESKRATPTPATAGPANRPPCGAGDYYAADPATLRHDVQRYAPEQADKVTALGCLVPHDSHNFSGHVAGAVYGRLQLPQRYLMLCPNHTGTGQRMAMMSEGTWETPLGRARIDRELASELGGWFRMLREDEEAHRHEYGIEVQLPFLQVLQPEFTFVPISVSVGQYEPLVELGEALAKVVSKRMHEVLIVASSNMNHYEADTLTRWKDEKLLESILALDARGLFEGIRKYDVNMCGFASVVVLLTAARWLGAHSAELVRYATTGDITDSKHTVIGYAGVIVR